MYGDFVTEQNTIFSPSMQIDVEFNDVFAIKKGYLDYVER